MRRRLRGKNKTVKYDRQADSWSVLEWLLQNNDTLLVVIPARDTFLGQNDLPCDSSLCASVPLVLRQSERREQSCGRSRRRVNCTRFYPFLAHKHNTHTWPSLYPISYANCCCCCLPLDRQKRNTLFLSAITTWYAIFAFHFL